MITHTHSDHVAGLDDLRVFYWPDQVKLPLYTTAHHGVDIQKRVSYMFEKEPGSPSYFQPPFEMKIIAAGDNLQIGDIRIDVLHQEHGLTDSLGFILMAFAAIQPMLIITRGEFSALSNIPLWIVETLRE